MDKLILYVLFTFSLGGVLMTAAPLLRLSNQWRKWFSATWAALLAFWVTLFPHYMPLTFGEGRTVIAWATDIRNYLFKDDAALSRFINERCLLVDVGKDLELVPDIRGGQGEHVITDRSKLASAITQLAQDTGLFDLLILDVYFQDIEPKQDSVIHDRLSYLAACGKLALAYDQRLSTDPIIYRPAPDPIGTAYGEVRERLNEGTYYHHALFRQVFQGVVEHPSLPYRAYSILRPRLRITHTWSPFNLAWEEWEGGSQLICDRFAPRFALRDPTLPQEEVDMVSTMTGHNSEEQLITPSLGTMQAAGLNTVPLYLCDTAGMYKKTNALHVILENERGAERPVVVIGNFSDPVQDVHATVNGQMHGAFMITSMLYELLEDRHANVVPLFLLLFGGLALTAWSLILRIFKVKGVKSEVKHGRLWRFLRESARFLFIDELHFWMMFLIMVIAQVATGRVINIMVLFVVYALLEAVLRAWSKREQDHS